MHAADCSVQIGTPQVHEDGSVVPAHTVPARKGLLTFRIQEQSASHSPAGNQRCKARARKGRHDGPTSHPSALLRPGVPGFPAIAPRSQIPRSAHHRRGRGRLHTAGHSCRSSLSLSICLSLSRKQRVIRAWQGDMTLVPLPPPASQPASLACSGEELPTAQRRDPWPWGPGWPGRPGARLCPWFLNLDRRMGCRHPWPQLSRW